MLSDAVLTPDRVRELSGAALDEAVAREVMGWHTTNQRGAYFLAPNAEGVSKFAAWVDTWRPQSDPACREVVWDWLEANTSYLEVRTSERRREVMQPYYVDATPKGGAHGVAVEAPDRGTALCRAALLLVVKGEGK